MSKSVNAAISTVTIAMVDLLKEHGLAHAGDLDALLAYRVLGEAKAQAEAFDVPLAEIGLDGFDLDALLRLPAKKAA